MSEFSQPAYDAITPVERSVNLAIVVLREARKTLSEKSLVEYGGRGYPRFLSLSITKLEEAVLWMGGILPEEPED